MSFNKFSNFEVEHVPDDEIGLGMADDIENIKDNSDNDKTDENINDNSDSDSNPDWNPYEDKELMAKIGYLKSDDINDVLDNIDLEPASSEDNEEYDTSEVITKQPSLIYCAQKINVQGTIATKKTHEDIDKIDFKTCVDKGKAFVEFLIKPEYVHLYFDVDDAKTMDEYLCFKQWLKCVSDVFGKYSIGGYTNSDEFAKLGYRLWKGSDKVLSLHVVFYETCISSKDLMDIMKTKNGTFVDYQVNPLCDANVYKLNSRQAFRHVLTDKR